ncbi:2-hydroxyacid dehydrogenase [Peribacillus alkalitolerans]|uniref:2-hydroxyacid dehydrogenase n=1 Tax=Peribacillus alkalitolerans TaxID=1550385 RepID=UPI0013D6FCF6|nr:D-glycerate dehydrogenase [Peribacillus alkalitolerans]
MENPYIFITRKLSEHIIRPLREKFQVEMWMEEDQPVPRDILMNEAKRADALITMLSDKIDEELLNVSQSLKVVANLAVGFDNIDIKAASDKGIVVCNTPDVLTDTTADLTFALLMATARRISEAVDLVKSGGWKSWSPLLMAGHDVHHKTIGIVGMGSIGEAVAKRAKGFDMEILYYNRNRKLRAEEQLGAKYCEFQDLIETSDFIVCLTPLTEETFHLFDLKAFQSMKRTAIFINAARGPVVKEGDLYEALIDKEIAAAGLDVFEVEPIGADHPLLCMDNVVALPHIGSSSTETRETMMKLCAENVERVLTGKEPRTKVTSS